MVFEDAVLDFIDALDLDEDEVAQWVKSSAITSSYEGANRRYHQWVFLVQGDAVISMRNIETGRRSGTMQAGPGEFLVYEDHEACNGAGCKDCQQGSIPVIRKSQ